MTYKRRRDARATIRSPKPNCFWYTPKRIFEQGDKDVKNSQEQHYLLFDVAQDMSTAAAVEPLLDISHHDVAVPIVPQKVVGIGVEPVCFVV